MAADEMNNESRRDTTIIRVGLWLASFVSATALFDGLFCAITTYHSFPGVFTLVMKFGSPLWLIGLPFVVILKNLETRRTWVVITTGTLAAPLYSLVFGLIVQARGGNARNIWLGDGGINLGIVPTQPVALIIASLTTALYLFGLRLIRSRSIAKSNGPSL